VDSEATTALVELLSGQDLGALGTLRAGSGAAMAEPFVSMVPVAWLGSGDAVIHVSALASHTRDLLVHPRASLMLMAPRTPGDNPQAVARVTLQVEASRIEPAAPEHAAAGRAYLARFARAQQTFALADFSLLRLVPRSARFVAGFGSAHGLRADEFRAIAAQAARVP
jgi:putative heme iron utilization protein